MSASVLFCLLNSHQAQEANKCANELSDRKKELKEAMFDNKLASFPSISET